MGHLRKINERKNNTFELIQVEKYFRQIHTHGTVVDCITDTCMITMIRKGMRNTWPNPWGHPHPWITIDNLVG